jgi:hypothetical protein
MMKMGMDVMISTEELSISLESDSSEDKATLNTSSHNRDTRETSRASLLFEGREDLQKLETTFRRFADMIKATLDHKEI